MEATKPRFIILLYIIFNNCFSLQIFSMLGILILIFHSWLNFLIILFHLMFRIKFCGAISKYYFFQKQERFNFKWLLVDYPLHSYDPRHLQFLMTNLLRPVTTVSKWFLFSWDDHTIISSVQTLNPNLIILNRCLTKKLFFGIRFRTWFIKIMYEFKLIICIIYIELTGLFTISYCC